MGFYVPCLYVDVGLFFPYRDCLYLLPWLIYVVIFLEWWGPLGSVWLIPYLFDRRFVDLYYWCRRCLYHFVVFAVLFCSCVRCLVENGSITFPHADRFGVYARSRVRSDCTGDICPRCGGLCG